MSRFNSSHSQSIAAAAAFALKQELRNTPFPPSGDPKTGANWLHSASADLSASTASTTEISEYEKVIPASITPRFDKKSFDINFTDLSPYYGDLILKISDPILTKFTASYLFVI